MARRRRRVASIEHEVKAEAAAELTEKKIEQQKEIAKEKAEAAPKKTEVTYDLVGKKVVKVEKRGDRVYRSYMGRTDKDPSLKELVGK